MAADGAHGGDDTGEVDEHAFQVHLDNFEGPFDLLLGLISKHKLMISSGVTDALTC